MPGQPMAAVEVKRGWVLHIDGKDRTVHEYYFRPPPWREEESERRMIIWFTDGHQVSGEEGQTIFVVSEGA